MKEEKDREMKSYRKARESRISQLSDFRENYSADKLIVDLVKYFGEEADFDIDKMQKEISKPGKLDGLIKKAKEKNTHPVIEFIQELFKDIYSQD